MSTQTKVPKWSEMILKLREKLQENQTEFGARFGVSPMAVSRWERGERNLNTENVRTLVNIDGGRAIVGEIYGLEK